MISRQKDESNPAIVYWLNGDLNFLHRKNRYFFKLGFTLCKAEQPLRRMELQEKEVQKDYSIQEICLERNYS